ncbi:CCNB1 protein, partial [Galbula dea]|nr:CCNB1 protein [Galbula dea]
SSSSSSEDELCLAFSEVLLDMEDVDMEDVDVEDDSDPSFCSSYVKDIYKYLRELEEKQPIRPKYLEGQEISGSMRAVLVDWLVRVQQKLRLHQDTLYMTVAIIDRFMQDNAVSKKMFLLVGITAMFIASKYQEVVPPSIRHLAYIINNGYTKSEIRQMEREILTALDFSLGRPLPPHFLRRVSKIAKVELKQHILAKYLMELSIVDYDMVHFPPSKTAAAASCLAMKLFDTCKWSAALQCYTTYTESDLLPLMQHIAKNVVFVKMGKTKQKAIHYKYASKKNARISTIEQLDSPIILHLSE